jgi:hypothetical protein
VITPSSQNVVADTVTQATYWPWFLQGRFLPAGPEHGQSSGIEQPVSRPTGWPAGVKSQWS